MPTPSTALPENVQIKFTEGRYSVQWKIESCWSYYYFHEWLCREYINCCQLEENIIRTFTEKYEYYFSIGILTHSMHLDWQHVLYIQPYKQFTYILSQNNINSVRFTSSFESSHSCSLIIRAGNMTLFGCGRYWYTSMLLFINSSKINSHLKML